MCCAHTRHYGTVSMSSNKGRNGPWSCHRMFQTCLTNCSVSLTRLYTSGFEAGNLDQSGNYKERQLSSGVRNVNMKLSASSMRHPVHPRGERLRGECLQQCLILFCIEQTLHPWHIALQPSKTRSDEARKQPGKVLIPEEGGDPTTIGMLEIRSSKFIP